MLHFTRPFKWANAALWYLEMFYISIYLLESSSLLQSGYAGISSIFVWLTVLNTQAK